MTTTTTHLAAITPAKGEPFTLQPRPTPKPDPNDLLIAVKSVALNPADAIMRDQGLFIPPSTYPTVIGFDMAGLVLEVGANVPPAFKPNTRIAAYSAFVWKACDPDYGPFQEFCLVPWQHAVVLPEGMSWNRGSTLPVAVQVPLCAWDMMGIPRLDMGRDMGSMGKTTQTDSAPTTAQKGEALLIWGASSSVGTMGVQTARILRDDSTSSFRAVYATAGVANLDYVKSLGADRVFDYKDAQVVDAIISAAEKDGLVIRFCFLATGSLGSCQAVLKAFRRGGIGMTLSKIASAPPVPQDAEVVEGVETIFLMPSIVEEERLEQFRYWIGTWLRETLVKGGY
ncbi:hypothetical protein N7509_002270 [Penicillium cosmopolitanum]|uniref:Enoyl reductase (ER) domain-containing protein n=1 Tax=Penicillium cosmopolitanum TaxID=1131564 RepID=A0A9X0BD56_9EURO|nr:uncharacterized protein N7509_002270 [Penicillium cosmopolitanum]KAJ5408387.1 hypothetical protein N7509_002270 [Penicillium cosmopolitanum]